MNYKGVIFDLDGTLVNSLTDLANSVNTVLTEYKLPTYDIESYKYRVGNGIRKLVERSLPEGKQDLLEPVLARFKEIYAKHNLDHTAPYDGIVDLLKALQQQNIKIGVCTNKHDEAAKEIIRIIFGDNIFDEIIGDKQGLKRKPDPSKVLMIAKHWQLKPEEIAYLGDSDVDMQTAQNANMFAVGVLWGFRDAEELQKNGADVLLENPLELLEKVDFAK